MEQAMDSSPRGQEAILRAASRYFSQACSHFRFLLGWDFSFDESRSAQTPDVACTKSIAGRDQPTVARGYSVGVLRICCRESCIRQAVTSSNSPRELLGKRFEFCI